MAGNTFVTADLVAKETLVQLVNNLRFCKWLKQPYNGMFNSGQNGGYMPGDTISFKYPPRYTFRNGMTATPQATQYRRGSITLTQGGVDMSFSAVENTLENQGVQDKISIAAQQIAQTLDRAALIQASTAFTQMAYLPSMSAVVSAQDGTSLLMKGQTQLDMQAAPSADRLLAASPFLNGSLIQSFAGLYNPETTISTTFKSGIVSSAYGMEIQKTQNAPQLMLASVPASMNATTGLGVTAFAVSGGVPTLTIASASTFSLGVPFYIKNANGYICYSSPADYTISTGIPAVFTTYSASTGTTVQLRNDFQYATDQTQVFNTITRLPTTGDVMVTPIVGGNMYDVGILAQKQAMIMACVRLKMANDGVGGVNTATRTLNGISLSVSSQWDYTSGDSQYRLDVCYGFAAPYPLLGTRLLTPSTVNVLAA